MVCGESVTPQLCILFVLLRIVLVRVKEEAIDLLARTQDALMTLGKIRLHKFVSNDGEVMKNLPSEDLAKDLKEINLNSESLPVQRGLGLYWDLETDSFIFGVSLKDTPFTRRGVLSTVTS